MRTSARLVLMAIFMALISLGAFIRIPIPFVPFTLQLLFTLLAGLLLGPKYGSLSVAGYIAAGLTGLPVFADGGGLLYVLQPTFGYLLGFMAGAFVMGHLAAGRTVPSKQRLLAAAFSALLVVYTFGIAYYWLICTLYLGTGIGFWTLFWYCFLLPVPGDALLCVAVALLGRRLVPILRQRGLACG